jgi:hypothetical protein
MTTIPGHNIVIQQSGAVHEATQHVRPNRPDPQQIAAQQALKAEIEKTTVPESKDAQGVTPDKQKEKKERKASKDSGAERQKDKGADKDTEDEKDPTRPGNLLDTIA